MDNNKPISMEEVPVPQYTNMVSGYQTALQLVDDVILKNYVSNLSKYEIVPLEEQEIESNIKDNVRFFKISEMVYEKDEFASQKFLSVFNSLATINCSIFIIIDSDGQKTDFYMGIRTVDEDRTASSVKDILKNSMIGQFPGIKTTDLVVDEMQRIINGIDEKSISSVSCVANSREEKQNKNAEFVQGLEKLVLSMSGQKYTGIIIADTIDSGQLRELRKAYESIYTQLSPFASIQINYGQNSSAGINESHADGTNESVTKTISESDSHGTTTSKSISLSHSVSSENMAAKIVKGAAGVAAAVTAGVSACLAPETAGISLGIGGLLASGMALMGSGISKTRTNSISGSYTKSTSDTHTYGESTGTTMGTSHTHTYGTNMTEGLSNALTLTAHDKSIEDMLERIDKQLKRMDEFESLGLYSCSAYFLSANQYASEMAAATYKAIVGGINSGVEVAAINTWGNEAPEKTKMVSRYVKNFIHPVFHYDGAMENIEVTPGSMVSGSELAIHMGLPRKSVCGLPVIEHADFGKEVVNYDGNASCTGINLGKVFNMGSACANDVILDKESLSMHSFVTGSTGSGKSNTIYEMVRQCENMGLNFLIIEPAKGEYKNVFGNRTDVNVYGSNPEYSELLRINPFKFPKGIHVLEHVDRLTEIFNVCWPMYAAMPAVLKDALLKSYEDCGWNIKTSKNLYDDNLFPTFCDLQEELVEVINNSSYSEEVKSNYMGSLVTRIKSLTNGLNGQLFTSNEIDNTILFDRNVIVDLSRIAAPETKALIMGLLIMRLSEYRMSTTKGMNVPVKHITVLEEAHNILRRTSTEQNPENPSVAGKSVEMISNAIAEMRTHGEGFIIVDQSPNAVDISAIRNTNTKIIMRLPDESDRRLAGKAAGLKDEQLDEIAKLPKGVAVVYQNDWVDPVLCKINKYKGEESLYVYEPMGHLNWSTARLKKNLLGILLKTRVKNPIDVNVQEIYQDLKTAEISSKSKLLVKKIANEYELRKELSLWNENSFENLSKVISGMLNGNVWIKPMVDTSTEFDVLTDRIMHAVKEQVNDLPSEYAIATAQCLMRAEVAKSDDYKEIYSAWITDLVRKGVF